MQQAEAGLLEHQKDRQYPAWRSRKDKGRQSAFLQSQLQGIVASIEPGIQRGPNSSIKPCHQPGFHQVTAKLDSKHPLKCTRTVDHGRRSIRSRDHSTTAHTTDPEEAR